MDLTFTTCLKVLVIAVTVFASCVLAEKQCLKDDAYGQQAANVYWCNTTTHTECCTTEQLTFDCCRPTATKVSMNQIILWSVMGGVVAIAALGFCCLCTDRVYCADTCHETCCRCCKKKKGEEGDLLDRKRGGEYGFDSPMTTV